jgi:hypothetical protein
MLQNCQHSPRIYTLLEARLWYYSSLHPELTFRAELPASPVAQWYELPSSSPTPRAQNTSRLPNSTWSSASYGSTVATTPTTSPPPPYRPKFAPAVPQRKALPQQRKESTPQAQGIINLPSTYSASEKQNLAWNEKKYHAMCGSSVSLR